MTKQQKRQAWNQFNRDMVRHMTKENLMALLSKLSGKLENDSDDGNQYATELLQFIYEPENSRS